MDPITETILDILGPEIARRFLGPESQAIPIPTDEPVRQGAAGSAQGITSSCGGPDLPWDVIDEIYEDRLFDRLMGEEDGCHQRRAADRRQR